MSLTEKELIEVRQICDSKNVQASAVETDVIDAINEGVTTLADLGAWLDKQRETRKHLFVDLTVVDLESRAFGEHGKPNVSARGQLVRSLGEIAALARAKEWGLRDLNDYRTRGTRPGNANADNKKPGRKSAGSNPWSREGWNITKQGALYRANPKAAAEIAAAAGSFIGATRPAAA